MAFRYSEVSKRQKKRFYFSLVVFLVGFVILALVGEKINDDGFIFIAFFSPLIILIGIIGIAWSLYHEIPPKS